MHVSAKSRNRIKHSGMLPTFISFESRTRKVAQAHEKLFLTRLFRPFHDRDIHLPITVVDFCMLNVCSSIV